MPSKWKRGDVVRLASGGPPMTVTGDSSAHPGLVWCMWFDSTPGPALTQEFQPDALITADAHQAAQTALPAPPPETSHP